MYVRGIVINIYNDTTVLEQPIYGSSRLGMYKHVVQEGAQTLGQRSYELSNHLGNVLAVITDNIHMAGDSAWTTVSSTSEYYPFGLDMEGRSWRDTTALATRYGFNGKEKDSKQEWGSTTYDYGFRIYNPTIAKFLSVDPLTQSYPVLTPYQFASNTPIQAIDLDGLEANKVIEKAEIYIGTLYEWNGKNPNDEFIGIKNNLKKIELTRQVENYLDIMKKSEPSYQERILFPKLEKSLPFQKGDKIDWQYTPSSLYETIRQDCYDILGYSILLDNGQSFGLDCSGLVNIAYREDKELEGGFTVNGGSSNILNLASNAKTAIRKNGILAAIVFDNPNFVSQADLIWQKDHIMIATGNVEKDKAGNVTAFEVIHSTGGKGVVLEKINYKKDKFKFIHPFRTSDTKREETTDIRWNETISTKQWEKTLDD
jgi:RHS repeat-associated protein